MKSIVLTTFENNWPLHSFILLTCEIVNKAKPIITIVKAKII